MQKNKHDVKFQTKECASPVIVNNAVTETDV
jgi:hypothetical protein